jgi:hypothetical protein
MRRILSCVIGLSISMFFAGLASTASAQATQPSAHAELIKSLHCAHKLLAHADKDYDGHRLKAAEEVHKALKELGYQHKKAHPGSTPANGAAVPAHTAHAKMHEPQGNSDAQMREALQILQGALTHFNGTHPKAVANVNAAIAQINTALAIK